MATVEIKIMATPRKSKTEETPPATTPMEGAVFGSADHSFTLQAIMDLKGSMAELKSSFESLKASVDSTKSKVDDLVNWKHKILGGAVVLGAVITISGFFVGKFWDYVTIKTPAVQSQSSSQASPDIKSPTLSNQAKPK